MTNILLKAVDLPNGETIAYRERSGGEEIILLIHGNMTSSKHWDLFLEKLDPKYKVYAIDLRGFGRSSYYNRIYSINEFAEDVELFVNELKLQDFIMVGWSTGGAVGMEYVASYPNDCKKLVLLASASTRGYPFYGTTKEGLPDVQNRLKTYEEIKNDQGKTVQVQAAYDMKNREFLKTLWNMLIYTHNQPDEQRYEQYIDDMMTQRNLAEVYYALNTFNISHHSNEVCAGTNKVKNINIPVLVLRGEQDLVVTAQMTEEIVADLGAIARYVELKGCGHSPLVDDIEQTLSVIYEFLENNGGH
ncbi:alpha/beta hydrolase [Bacillus aquiflavi]|nr:alpha/beta hydrolase [Bacillus aquiflavi]MBA4535719.1 alpha/beta hydrolase [Bacillus aquiflavi]UAC49019.1 alpha/beta hydrolase [Bacillus aquiflavi]